MLGQVKIVRYCPRAGSARFVSRPQNGVSNWVKMIIAFNKNKTNSGTVHVC